MFNASTRRTEICFWRLTRVSFMIDLFSRQVPVLLHCRSNALIEKGKYNSLSIRPNNGLLKEELFLSTSLITPQYWMDYLSRRLLIAVISVEQAAACVSSLVLCNYQPAKDHTLIFRISVKSRCSSCVEWTNSSSYLLRSSTNNRLNGWFWKERWSWSSRFIMILIDQS